MVRQNLTRGAHPLWLWRHLRTIRSRIFLLALAIAGPAILATAAIVWFGYQAERRNAETQLMATSRAVAVAVDRQLGQAEALLWALAASPQLSNGDVSGFDTLARQAVKLPGSWIVLADHDGRQLVNTRLPPGSALPQRAPDDYWNRLRPERPLVTVFIGPAVGSWVVALEIPVMEQNTARYSLAFSWLPPAFNQTLVQQNLPPAWIGTILDRDDKVIARSRDPDRFLGQPATPDLRARLADSNDGILRSVSLDGIPTVVAYSRSPTYGWAAVVAVPQSEVFANVRRSMGWILVLAIGLITAGLLASAVTARLITRPLKMLQEAAEATGQGALRDPPKTGLVEVDEVGAALRRSAVQIQERERRQELLRHELDHRAKNLLTVVMSILQLTRAQDTKTFIENVLGRIMALARTHNLLADTGWERVELRRLLIDNLEPFLSRDRKFTIHGPSIELEASAGQVIGIIIHELVTNSAKYGALSASRGELNVAWRLMQEGLDFHWAERGGPHVSRPLGRGFGLTVIEASVAKQLEGRVSLEWLAEGLRATLWIPRNHVAGQNAPAAPNFGENAVVKKPADVAGRASEEIIQA